MTDLQAGDAVVVIAAGSFLEFPTEVVAVEGSSLVLARPAVSLLHPPERCEQAVLAWSASGARYELRVRVDSIDEEGSWHLRPLGAPERIQRRRYFRVPLVHRCRIGADDLVLEGMVLDISEGGALCRVPRCRSLTKGSDVQLDLYLGDAPVSTSARVVQASPAEEDTTHLRVEISDTAASDVVRRHVYAFQLRDRALRA